MKPTFIIGNWKSNKNSQEATQWFDEAEKLLAATPIPSNKTVVICVPFTLLALAHMRVANTPSLHLGSQDVSPFSAGAYTGAINAGQVKEFATHVIIGHSERRRYFQETDEMLSEKVQQAISQQLTPVYLVQSENDPIPKTVKIVGYEPVGAIGTGHPDSPENANEIAIKIKTKNPFVEYVLYGGSVTAGNVASFTALSDIHGVIPGGASLTPQSFFPLIHNA